MSSRVAGAPTYQASNRRKGQVGRVAGGQPEFTLVQHKAKAMTPVINAQIDGPGK